MFGLTQKRPRVKTSEKPLRVGVSDQATSPMEGVSNVEEPAFQPGTWRLWGLAVVFVAALVAFFLADILAVWAAVVWKFPDARSLPGFIALLHDHADRHALWVFLESPARLLVGVTARSAAAIGTIYCLRGLLPARSMRAFGFIKPKAEQLGFGLVGAVLVVFGGIAAQVALRLIVGHRLPGLSTPITATHHGVLAYVIDILQGSVVTPIAEETLFRGLLFAGLVQRMGPVPAALVSATLFGLWHFEPYALPHLIIAGLVQAYVFYRTRNLWAAILTHGIVNWVAFTSAYLFPIIRSGHPS